MENNLVENTQVADAILDMRDVESREELDAMVVNFDDEIRNNDDVKNVYEEMRTQFEPETPETKIVRLEARIRELENASDQPRVDRPKIQRIGNRYRLVTMDLSKWDTKKPQVHALVKILGKEFGVGVEVAESQIIEAVEKNAADLRTRQEPKRIWQYYKGDHTDGLTAHGIIEKVL